MQQYNQTEDNGGNLATARLLNINWHNMIALPPLATLELLEEPKIISVPGSNNYSYGLVFWQKMWIPLIDLAFFLQEETTEELLTPKFCLVVRYRDRRDNNINYGALAVLEIPQTITVDDATFFPLPDNSERWFDIAVSCFLHDDKEVPIIDTCKLFS